MILKWLLNLFKVNTKKKDKQNAVAYKSKSKKKVEPTRIGELGEYKINIQLDQLPKDCKYLSDIMIANTKSRSGYSQIDHVVISQYGIFVIETKNYNGEIKGNKSDKYWLVNKKFKMYNPLFQNYGHIKALTNVLSAYKELKFISIISFTMRCRFGIDPELRKIASNELVIYDVELTDYIQRKLARIKMENPEHKLHESEINNIYQLLNGVNITDPKIRNEHIDKARKKPKK